MRTVDPSLSGQVERARAGAASTRSVARAEPTPATDDSRITLRFDTDASTDTSLTTLSRDAFAAAFHDELARLLAWSAREQWQPQLPAELRVVVSEAFAISRSLVPAWFGHPGRMEFPARRVAAGRAAIMHELVHVLFPNGNRLLAEGFAIALQAMLGGNPAFPNFGTPLHALARTLVPAMVPEFSPGEPASLARLRLEALDAIATPAPLALTVAGTVYGEDPHGQAHLYPLAGSFVQFLLETHGTARFRDLYRQTPLKPRQQAAGTHERWAAAYGLPLATLVAHWASFIAAMPEGRLSRPSRTTHDPGKPQASRTRSCATAARPGRTHTSKQRTTRGGEPSWQRSIRS